MLALFLDDAGLGPDGYLASVGPRDGVVVAGDVPLHTDSPSTEVIKVTRDLEHGQVVAGVGRAREAMSGLRHAGYRFALDDFGADCSGLGGLRCFEFVEIDRSFAQAIGSDQTGATILDSLIELADELGTRTVVEGIETELQLQYVQAQGVRYAQGWLFSTPLSVDELERFLASATPATRSGRRAAE